MYVNSFHILVKKSLSSKFMVSNETLICLFLLKVLREAAKNIRRRLFSPIVFLLFALFRFLGGVYAKDGKFGQNMVFFCVFIPILGGVVKKIF